MKPTRLFDLLDRNMSLFPDSDALAEKQNGIWVKYTFRQYNEFAHWFALGLLELGFNKDDKIATITHNRPEWNFVDVGMSMIGVVHVPVYTSLNNDEYRYVFEHSDARMIIVADIKYHQAIQPICEQVPKVEYLFTFSKSEGAKHWLDVVELGKNCKPETIKQLETLKKEILPSDAAALIYTSGTTGTSKGVLLSHQNLVSNFLAAAKVFNMGPGDRYLNILPLCHVGGRMGNYQTQYVGACIYFAENMGTIAANLKEIKATGFDAVPRIIEKVFDNVDRKSVV